MKRIMIVGASIGCILQTFAAEPKVTGVSVTQEGGKIIVAYRLTDAPAVVSVDFQTNVSEGVWVSIGCDKIRTLSGDVDRKVDPDSSNDKKIVWKAGKDWPHQKIDKDGFRALVSVRSVFCPPDWMTISIADGAVRYYMTEAAIPGGFADARYRTSHVLLRKVPAAGESFRMGASVGEGSADETAHEVGFTNDWYMAVFETTQGQYLSIMGVNPSNNKEGAAYPVEQVSYEDLRGAGCDWPGNGHATGSESFFGILQSRTGMIVDLPTEAQWEYSCRAGTTSGLNNGKELSADAGAGSSLPELEEVAWCSCNTEQTMPVGTRKPNDWNLFDMHGNVYEACLDWYGEYAGDAIDPTGPNSGSDRVNRGGSFQYYSTNLRSAKRSHLGAGDKIHNVGFRICAEAVAR